MAPFPTGKSTRKKYAPCYNLSVRIELLYFAIVRERVGADGETLEVPAGTTCEQALRLLGERHPALVPLLPRLQGAVNREMADPKRVLCEGDEVALIPPVAGGAAARRIAVLGTPLSVEEVMAAVTGPAQGAIVTFTGCVRRDGQVRNVARLEYEAFVPMAEQVLTDIADEIEREWPGARVAIQHRTGILTVGEPAVVIAVTSPHRSAAFEACRAAIDRLKERVPIWKKEIGADGAEWVGLGP